MTTTYSFKDQTTVISNPLVGSFTIRGQVGAGAITFSNTTDRSAHDLSADGSVMVSYIAGDNGTCTLEMQQNSLLHTWLLALYNALKTLADAGDVSNWAATSIQTRASVGGAIHNATGVSFQKVPDKAYAAAGAKLVWPLMIANLINTN